MSAVYWCVLLAVIILGITAEANPKTILSRNGQSAVRPDPIAALMLALVLILVAGFRYRVGSDYDAYFRWHVGDWSEVFQDFIRFREGGFSLLAKLSRLLWDHGQSLIFISAAITIGLYAWTIYRYSPMYLLSMLLYLFLGQWQGSFNGIRQYLAAAILFAGHRLILEKKLWQYLLVVLAASLFHVSAVVMIVPCFLFNRKADIPQLALLALGAVVIRFSYSTVFSLIGSLRDKAVSVNSAYASTGINVFRILTAFIPVAIFLVLCRKNDLSREQNFYANALFFHAATFIIDGKSYAVSAVSGTGKTTLLRSCKELLGRRVGLINGDKTIIRCQDGQIIAYGTPWRGKERWGENRSSVLTGIILLSRGEENHIEEVDPMLNLAALMQQVYIPVEGCRYNEKLVEILDHLIGKTRIYRMTCRKDPEAARVLFKGINIDLGE